MPRGDNNEGLRFADRDDEDDVGYGGGTGYDDDDDEDGGWTMHKDHSDSLWDSAEELGDDEEAVEGEEGKPLPEVGEEEEEDGDLFGGGAAGERRPAVPP